MVSVVLDNLTAGEAAEKIAVDYRITLEDECAALQYQCRLWIVDEASLRVLEGTA